MAKCKNCKHLDYAENVLEYGINKIPYCFFNEDIEDVCEERECFAFEVITNADRIRSMRDEELAEWIAVIHACVTDDKVCYLGKTCYECTLEWLKSEVGCE